MISRQIFSSFSSPRSSASLLVALPAHARQLLARRRRAQQRVAALDEDRPLLGDQLVVAPGVAVDLEQPALGDALRVVQQAWRPWC